MRILILGGAGFIGSHLVELLQNNANHEMVVLDNLSSGLEDNIPQSIQFYKMDVRDHEMEDVFKKHKFDVVVNLAAQTMVPFSLEHPDVDADINILGLINVLECCRKYGVKRIIFSSSAAVYGNNTKVPLTEKEALTPMSFYGISKMVAEHYLRVYHELYGLDAIVFRFANVYGERQGNGGEGGVVSIFGRRIAEGLPLVLFGDGGQTRDFVYAGDIAEAIIASLNAEGYLILNVSNKIEVSINELIEKFSAVSQKHFKVEYKEARNGDIYRSCLDNTALIKALNTSPQTSLQEGLAKTYTYFAELVREEGRLG
ncbi:MAG: NAD-dependent epimerase/dehydratase family protein [Negativicutes bacterium]|nr:NAD-dependent epimerase/dehydratase family protein [Negativicutes bacterium]